MSNDSGRKLPTRPGAWWWQDNLGIGNPPRVIPVLEVADDEAPYLLAIMPALPTSLFVPVALTGGTWLAEVLPPAECAAWDAAGRPSAALLTAFGEFARCFRAYDAGGSPEYLAVSNASAAMRDAIRAERDGAA